MKNKKQKFSFKDMSIFENIEVKGVKILNCINPDVTNIKDRRFNAICGCGKPRLVRQYDIVHRQKLNCKECGWKKIALSKKKTDSGLNNVILHYRKGAERRNIPFNLSKEQVKFLTSQNCQYCGKEPHMLSFSNKTWNNRSQYIYNSIDRLDSNKAYDFENCTTACKRCNISKNTMTVEEFYDFVRTVYFYLKDKKDDI